MANTFTMEPSKEDVGSMQLHKSVGEGLGKEDVKNTSQVICLFIAVQLSGAVDISTTYIYFKPQWPH